MSADNSSKKRRGPRPAQFAASKGTKKPYWDDNPDFKSEFESWPDYLPYSPPEPTKFQKFSQANRAFEQWTKITNQMAELEKRILSEPDLGTQRKFRTEMIKRHNQALKDIEAATKKKGETMKAMNEFDEQATAAEPQPTVENLIDLY